MSLGFEVSLGGIIFFYDMAAYICWYWTLRVKKAKLLAEYLNLLYFRLASK